MPGFPCSSLSSEEVPAPSRCASHRHQIIREDRVVGYGAPKSNTQILPLFFPFEVAFPEQAFGNVFAVAGWNECNSLT